MRKAIETIGKRVATTIGAAMLALMMVGGAYALSGDTTPASDGTPTPEASPAATESPSPEPSGTPTSDEDTDEGESKGVERVHEGCGEIEGLEGNWNHGQYVSAVGRTTGDKDAKKAAAKSDCGKPVQSVHEDEEDSESDEQETDVDDDEDTEDDGGEDKPDSPGKSKR